MELKEIISQLNSELKKEVPDRKALISNINSLVNTYNSMINSLKARSEAIEKVEDLKKEIEKGEKKYKKKVIDLYTIFEIAKELSSSLNIDNLIKTIILTSIGHMVVETGAVFVLDEKLNKYLFRDAKGIKEDMSDIKFDADEEIIKYIIKHSKPIEVKELLSESFGSQYKEVLQRLNCKLLVPIIIKTKLNGILFLGPKAGDAPFTESNLEFLVALGNFAAIAIENARLYEDLDRKVQDLSTLYNISKEINKSNEIDVVLDLMLDTITTAFGVKKCSIILYNELKNLYYIERNYNISDDQAKTYLDLILKNKIENPLNKNESVVILNDSLLVDDDIFFSIPLIAGSKKVGLLNIYQFENNIINEDVKQIFSIIASQMAPPIVITEYLSKRDTYRENPFDYIYNIVDDMIIKAKDTGIEFVISRIKIFTEDISLKVLS